MPNLNEINPFKQMAKHRDFIHTMFELITDDDIPGFLRLATAYYIDNLRKDEDEIYSAFTLKIANGYVEESILEYMRVHVNQLAAGYKRFECQALFENYQKWSVLEKSLLNNFNHSSYKQ